MNHADGVSVVTPTVIYAWTKTKEEFNKIQAEETIHAWADSEATTLSKGDGGLWETRCTSKNITDGDVMVIFQWFDERKKR